MEQRRRLAEELDAQGIYPPAWTTATRAPWSKQAVYRQTGFHDSAKHFIANGELYERANNPALTPSAKQAAESLKAYLGQEAKPIHEIVPIDQVPLTHPVGRPLTPQSPEEAAAMAKLLAEQAVNHETWHQGDPVPPAMQKWITANGYKTSDIYQGPDGWHYQRNERTLESPEITKLRLAEAAQQPTQQAADAVTGAASDPANAKMAQKILVDWHKAGEIPPPESSLALPIAGTSEAAIPESANDNVASPLEAAPNSASSSGDQDDASTAEASTANAQRAALETVVTALDKLKRNEKLDPQESSLLSGVQQTARANGLDLDLSKLDPDVIRRASGISNPTDPSTRTLLAATAIPFPTMGAPAAAPEAATAAGAEGILGTVLLPVTAFLYALGVFSNKTAGPEIDELSPEIIARSTPKQAATATNDLPPPPTTPVIPPLPPQIPPKDPEKEAPGINPPAPPETLKPFINTIPTGEGEFLKPSATPGWDTVPELQTDGILERWGGIDTRRRNILCREEAARIFDSLGYDVKERFGEKDGEHWFPNAEGGSQGGGWSDAGLLMKDPDGKFVTWHLNTYTANASGPIQRELEAYERILDNWLQQNRALSPNLSEKALKKYNWAAGALAMVAKAKKGVENDADFMKACRAAIMNQIDENGRLILDQRFTKPASGN
jgi:hypothetical protein